MPIVALRLWFVRVVLIGFGTLMCACTIEPDIVARAIDGGTGLTENDSGESPPCALGDVIQPVDCQIPVHWPTVVDPRFVNVNVMQGGVDPFGGVVSEENCDRVIHGWFWANDDYTRIGFCPQTCALIDQWQQLLLEFGCATRPPSFLPPRPPQQ